MRPGRTEGSIRGPWWVWAGPLGVWLAAVLWVGPGGEFPINDDWVYLRAMEAFFQEGRIIRTGWGPRQPSLVGHLLWATPFAWVGGLKITVLRIAVLSAGLLTVLGLVLLLRRAGRGPGLSLWAGLVLIGNPLFFSQSLTFMTDITFTFWLATALVCLERASGRSSGGWLAAAVAMGLMATLTRQLGLCLALGLSLVLLIHPWGREMGRFRAISLILLGSLIPWLAWEAFLMESGSTSVFSQAVTAHLLGTDRDPGLGQFLGRLVFRLGYAGLGTVALLTTPMLLVLMNRARGSGWRAAGFGLLWIGFPSLILAGVVNPPLPVPGNVLFNLGIGPLLFKDAYILGLNRPPGLAPAGFWAVILTAVPGMIYLVIRGAGLIRRLASGEWVDLVAATALMTSLVYLAVITWTGYHDRYLIPVILLTLIWVGRDHPAEPGPDPGLGAKAAAGVVLGLMAAFTMIGSHDLLAVRRAALEAQKVVMTELRVAPCDFDGGFEHNGYYCHRPDYQPRPGTAWWWVARERYLIGLGPLEGYRVIRKFPVSSRGLGPGAVYLLRPESAGAGSG